MLRCNPVADCPYLVQIQLPGQDHHIGIPRVEPQGLGVGDVELGGDMHLETNGAGIFYGCDVGGYDGRHSGSLGRIESAIRLGHILVVKDNVQGQIGLDTILGAVTDNLREVAQSKIVSAVRAHVQVLHPEIHRIGSGLHCRGKGLETSGRGHYLKPVSSAHLRR